jgi:hypothetical protein
MSTPFNPTLVITRKVNSDVSSQAWFLVKPVSDSDIDIASTGNVCMGALTNDVAVGTASIPAYVPVQVGGMIKVICGGTCTVGTFCMSDSSGEAVDVTGSKINAFGIALGTYVDGEIGSFLWAPTFMETT